MRRRLSEKSTFTLHMLHMSDMLKEKDIRRKSNGFELLPPPAGGPPPSKREVFGMENRASAECRRARDARPYNVAGNCNCEMCLQRWVASLQRSDVFATVGCTVVHRRGAHCAPVRPRRYNSNFSRGRAKGLRGDRKAPISNRRQGRKALTGEAPGPPSSREGDRPAGGGRSKRRSARPRGLGGDFDFSPLNPLGTP